MATLIPPTSLRKTSTHQFDSQIHHFSKSCEFQLGGMLAAFVTVTSIESWKHNPTTLEKERDGRVAIDSICEEKQVKWLKFLSIKTLAQRMKEHLITIGNWKIQRIWTVVLAFIATQPLQGRTKTVIHQSDQNGPVWRPVWSDGSHSPSIKQAIALSHPMQTATNLTINGAYNLRVLTGFLHLKR